ncbi:uncharacterized protein [Miscanthus floridulus]|uniref:uncharacterized protein isoform X2 n=1 Tax=Miscanthus floridulus TaxID=154761 RepID=UPI0034573D59
MPDGSGSGRDYGRGIGGRRLAVTLLLPRNPASATITAASEKRNSTASYAGCNSRMAATKAASQFVAPLQVATPYFLIATKPEAPSSPFGFCNQVLHRWSFFRQLSLMSILLSHVQWQSATSWTKGMCTESVCICTDWWLNYTFCIFLSSVWLQEFISFV